MTVEQKARALLGFVPVATTNDNTKRDGGGFPFILYWLFYENVFVGSVLHKIQIVGSRKIST